MLTDSYRAYCRLGLLAHKGLLVVDGCEEGGFLYRFGVILLWLG